MKFHIDTDALVEILPYIGKGMLGIFAVTAVIVFCIWLLNKIPAEKSDKSK